MIDEITVTASRSGARGRAPRGLVRLGTFPGTIVPGWVSWSVSNNSYFEADTFRTVFAVKKLPSANDANWFSTQKEIFAEVLAGFPQDPANPTPGELNSLIYGRVDNINYNPRDGLITLTGRDLTAAFIDAKIADEFQNQTSSDIATLLAGNHGLTPQVTETSTFVGTYYTQDQVSLTADRSEWDLLCLLARQEGFVVFVTGQTLYFGPNPRSTDNPLVVNWQKPSATNGSPIANVKGISFDRSLTVAKGITVTARSPSLTRKTPVTQSYPSAAKNIGAGKSSPFGATQQYFFTLPAGKTPVEVEAYAKAKYDDIISHEMKLSIHLPADATLDISKVITVQGTGTAYDQTYFPRLITRDMDLDGGYNMVVEAQNSSPDEAPQS